LIASTFKTKTSQDPFIAGSFFGYEEVMRPCPIFIGPTPTLPAGCGKISSAIVAGFEVLKLLKSCDTRLSCEFFSLTYKVDLSAAAAAACETHARRPKTLCMVGISVKYVRVSDRSSKNRRRVALWRLRGLGARPLHYVHALMRMLRHSLTSPRAHGQTS
jgi:hypothetical protein